MFCHRLPLARTNILGKGIWLVMILLAGGLSPVGNSPVGAAEFTPRPVPLIPSGTVVDDQVPPGWTHLINQSHSRIGTGDVDSIDDTIAHLASFLSSNLLARVNTQDVGGAKMYRLGEVAVGLGMDVGGKETIISSSTLRKQGIRLSLLEKLGLRRAEARLPKLMMIARSDTVAVFDGASHILRDGRHVEVMARHTVLVDERTGQLATFVWFIDLDDDGNYGGVFGPIDVLPPGARTELVLNVDSDLFVLGLITEKALAVSQRPDGLYRIEVPERFRETAGQAKLDQRSLVQTESTLRRLLDSAKQRASAQASP